MKRSIQQDTRFSAWCDVLVFIYRNADADNVVYATFIRTNLTFDIGHFTKVLKNLIEWKLVERLNKGKRKIYKLTPNGLVIGKNLDETYKLLFPDKRYCRISKNGAI